MPRVVDRPASGIRGWLDTRRRRRRRRRVLSRLATAEKLRASGTFSELDYSLVAVGVLAELDDRVSGVRRDRFEGRSWQFLEWAVDVAVDIELGADVGDLGPYPSAAKVVAQHVPGTGGRLPDGYGGWIADGKTFHWTPELTKLVAEANRRLTRLDRALRPVENAVTRFRANYPNVSLAVAAVLGMIAAAVIGFLFGQSNAP